MRQTKHHFQDKLAYLIKLILLATPWNIWDGKLGI